jgi:two-component system cell cycle sensor histidine kinase/response regulator CckA
LDEGPKNLPEAARSLAEPTASFFAALVETSSDMVAMASFDGQVLFVNKAGRELCGIAPDQDVRQLKLSDFHTEGGLARAAVIKEKGKWEGEGVLRHFVTGELIPVQVSSFIARTEIGEPLCFATVQRDLRETKRIEAQLREAQRMEALGRLAGGVAHDFNNLLTVILGNATLLRGAPVAPNAHARLVEIEHAAKSASELTRQLLVFSRRQVLERHVVDVGEVVERLRTLFTRLIGEDVRVELAVSASPATALVDPTQIEQIVVNLVLNARDAMPEGGTLRIGVDVVVPAEGAAGAPDMPPGPCVRITVADTGTGMADDVRARVFDPFFTTKATGKGTGLGLSIAYGAAKQNQGDISFQSEVGRGTTFFVHFPLVAQAVEARREDAASLLRGSERVWLVEDQPLVRSFVETALARLGYSVRSFASGEQLLESMPSLGPAEILVTDMVLPNVDGRALAERVLAERPEIRVVFASGYSHDVVSRHGELPETATFIAKPFTIDVLAKAVRAALDSGKAPARARCRHALIVDDDPMVLTVLAQLLDALGCAASTHKDPRGIFAAIDDAKGSSAPIDLVFLDVRLDGASGLDICKQLRQAGVDVAIVCVSGDVLSRTTWAEAGFDDVVNKPVDHDVLRACVERYAGWSHAAATPGPFLAAGGVGSRI